MKIAAYQIHNVLNAYSRQLSQQISGDSLDKESMRLDITRENFAATIDGKRQTIAEKVASDIVSRITRYGPSVEVEQQAVKHECFQLKDRLLHESKEKKEFIFQTIDDNGKKVVKNLSIENPEFLLKRMEQLNKGMFE